MPPTNSVFSTTDDDVYKVPPTSNHPHDTYDVPPLDYPYDSYRHSDRITSTYDYPPSRPVEINNDSSIHNSDENFSVYDVPPTRKKQSSLLENVPAPPPRPPSYSHSLNAVPPVSSNPYKYMSQKHAVVLPSSNEIYDVPPTHNDNFRTGCNVNSLSIPAHYINLDGITELSSNDYDGPTYDYPPSAESFYQAPLSNKSVHCNTDRSSLRPHHMSEG